MELFSKSFSKVLVALTIFLFGCAPVSRYYVKQDVNLSYVESIAVLPLQNNTNNKYAGERIRDIVITEILALKIFKVVDKSFVDSIFAEGSRTRESINKKMVNAIARRLKVQAIMMGSVIRYDIERKGTYSYPVVSISLRLLDGETGDIIWQATGVETGYSIIGRLLGVGGKDITEVSISLVDRLLETIVKK